MSHYGWTFDRFYIFFHILSLSCILKGLAKKRYITLEQQYCLFFVVQPSIQNPFQTVLTNNMYKILGNKRILTCGFQIEYCIYNTKIWKRPRKRKTH